MTATQQMIVDLLQAPSRENYVRLWEQVTTSPDYDPYSDPYGPIEDALEAGENERAQDAIRTAVGQLLLSPRVHMLASITAKRLGDLKAASMEQMFYARCIEAMLATGDGTEASPYLVTRTSDEYDLLFHLDKKLQTQSLVHEDDRSFDVMQCEDGTEIYFDITRVIGSLAKRHK